VDESRKKRTLVWVVGAEDLGLRWIADALDQQRVQLGEVGIQVAGTPTAWQLATAELRRNHKDLGWKRAEVEGQCATIARRVWKHKGVSIVSMPGLAAATPDQVDLALDGFRGVHLHLVFVMRNQTEQAYAAAQANLETGGTTRPSKYVDRVLNQPGHPQADAFMAGHDLAAITSAWTLRMRGHKSVKTHVIEADDPYTIWHKLGEVAGFMLPLPAVEPSQLTLDGMNLLHQVVGETCDGLTPSQLREVVGNWLVSSLLPRTFQLSRADESIDSAHALGLAVAEVARLRAENLELRHEVDRLDRKRRKLKRRLKADEPRVDDGSSAA